LRFSFDEFYLCTTTSAESECVFAQKNNRRGYESLYCLGDALEKNGVSLALDAASIVVGFLQGGTVVSAGIRFAAASNIGVLLGVLSALPLGTASLREGKTVGFSSSRPCCGKAVWLESKDENLSSCLLLSPGPFPAGLLPGPLSDCSWSARKLPGRRSLTAMVGTIPVPFVVPRPAPGPVRSSYPLRN
jgi:hypothetical protein